MLSATRFSLDITPVNADRGRTQEPPFLRVLVCADCLLLNGCANPGGLQHLTHSLHSGPMIRTICYVQDGNSHRVSSRL
jgi:hypothetical protein